jgi:putative intracellular protease/amidase
MSATKGKILVVVSNYGYWGEELVGPIEEIDKAGYTPVFVTPRGLKPVPLPPSIDANYIDPPLGKPVTTQAVVDKVKALDASDRLNKTINLSTWFPDRPYMSSGTYLRDLEAYYAKLHDLDSELNEYAAVLLVGGSGPVVDMVNNQRVHDIILGFLRLGKPIAAECYGVACLAFARDLRQRKSIIWGKRVTGHPIEYDYKDGTGFVGVDFNMGPPPYPLEYILRDATGPDGQYISNVGDGISVIVDYPFITGRSNESSYGTGQKLIEVLDKGLKRYGW